MKTISCRVAGVVLMVLAAMPAGAAEFGFYGVDLHGGITLPSDWDSGVAGGVSVNVGELVDGLYLFPGLFYAKAEESVAVPMGPLSFEQDFEITALSLGAEMRYFLAGEPAGWYFGGGAYLNRLTLDSGVRFGSGDRVEIVEVEKDELGAMGVAGYRAAMGERFSLGLEARYHVVTNFDNGQLLLVVGF